MSIAKLRHQDHYKAVTRELVAAGLEWREEFRGKHAALVVSVNGREETEFLSVTPSDHRALRNAVGHVRRRIKKWKAEAAGTLASAAAPAQFQTLENETMHDNTEGQQQATGMLELFFEGHAVRVRDEGDNPWFVLSDLCRALDIKNPSMAAKALDDDERAKLNLGRAGEATVISESGLYTLILRSRAATTPGTLEHRFRKWVTSEVLPSIRKAASSSPAPALPDDWERMLGMMKMLARKTTENEKALAEIQNYLTSPSSALVPSFNLAGSVTALEIITMAGIAAEQRVRGTSSAVTLRMKDFCLSNGFTALQTPVAIDASSRWRFQREAAQKWLYGPTNGAEFIRDHVAKRRAEKGGRGQLSLILGGRT